MTMKSTSYLLPAAFLFFTVNCFAAPRPVTAETAPAGEHQAQSVAPAALIRDLYKTHDQDNGAVVQGKNRRMLDKYFDKNLAGKIWKDMTTNNGEVGVIDFDLFYDAQDTEIKRLAVGAAKIKGDRATVRVTFENFKKKKTLTYTLVKEKSAWKIADINYGGDNTLLKYFEDVE